MNTSDKTNSKRGAGRGVLPKQKPKKSQKAEREIASGTEERVLLIGAGFAGLGMARALRERGIAYDQVEREKNLGGNWRYGVYETVHIISSRKTTEYPEFPMPADYPDFPSAGQMIRYLDAYADHYGLRESIHFKRAVEDVSRAGPLWRVRFSDGKVRNYKSVIVANGHHWDCRWPEYPGKFTGKVLHSKEYKNPSVLRGKRVLVVGGGNSACDIAVEAARFASESHISLRRGYWFMPKTILGKPMVEIMKPWMPEFFLRLLTKMILRITVGDYRRYGLQKPDHKPFEHHPTINTQLLYYLKHGRITAHPDIESMNGREVKFKDGTAREFDLIVYATGFHVSFPFLRDGILGYTGDMPNLVAGPFPLGARHLYFFGLGQPRYGAGPLISAGARFMAEAVLAQDKLQYPIGDVLRRLRQPLVKRWVMNPFAVMRRIRRGRRILPYLPTLEKMLMRRPPEARADVGALNSNHHVLSREA